MYCICCKQDKINKSSDEKLSEEDFLWSVVIKTSGKSEVTNRMCDGGIIHIIDAGYGSNFDGDKLIIAICDDCIKKELEDGVLLYHGNYMGYNGAKEIDRSKLIYRRRKNLDKLI